MRISDWSSDVCSSDLEEKAMRVVLAEPQTLVRAGLRHLLEIHASAQIVGEAADGAQLLELVGRLRPDVVVTELNLPQISGLESLLQIRRHYPEVAVLILSAPTDGHHVRLALKEIRRAHV